MTNTVQNISIKPRKTKPHQQDSNKAKSAEHVYTKYQFDILNKQKCFYESLYKSKNTDAEKFKDSSFFHPDIFSPLNEAKTLSCEELITSEECFNALKEFKVRKTHSSDGFPVEFYCFFWPEINKELFQFRIPIPKDVHKPEER